MNKASKRVLFWYLKVVWYFGAPAALSLIFLDLPLFNALWEYKFILFFAMAAFFNAIMDSIENEHILSTIFSRLNENFWSKRDSWDKAIEIFGYKIDAWHLAKSAMVICIAFSLLFYEPVLGFWKDLLIFGFVWNHTFNGFYTRLFSTKK